MLTSSGGSLNADVIRGGKICQNLADVICERSLTNPYPFLIHYVVCERFLTLHTVH